MACLDGFHLANGWLPPIADDLFLEPAEHAANLGSHLLDQVLGVVLQQRVVDRAVGLVFQDEFPGEGAGLDLGQDALHLMPGIVVDDARGPG